MGFFFAAAALPLIDITAAAVINMVFAACLKKMLFAATATSAATKSCSERTKC
jgi:hypothetical protein